MGRRYVSVMSQPTLTIHLSHVLASPSSLPNSWSKISQSSRPDNKRGREPPPSAGKLDSIVIYATVRSCGAKMSGKGLARQGLPNYLDLCGSLYCIEKLSFSVFGRKPPKTF